MKAKKHELIDICYEDSYSKARREDQDYNKCVALTLL
jgi:hypothetical protein